MSFDRVHLRHRPTVYFLAITEEKISKLLPVPWIAWVFSFSWKAYKLQQYKDTIVQFYCLLMGPEDIPTHQQWLVCIQSTWQHLINRFKLQLPYRKIKIDKHIPFAERQLSHLRFRVWKIIICAGVLTCYWNFPASNKEFCNCSKWGHDGSVPLIVRLPCSSARI